MAPNQRKAEKVQWAVSKSKAALRQGLLSGEIKPKMKPKQIWLMHPAHKEWSDQDPERGYSNWASNLATLRESYAKDKDRMAQDVTSYAHDLGVVNNLRGPNSKTPWHKSEAFKQLKVDVRAGKHKELKPAELHQTHDSYKEFTLEEFRKHIYQIADAEPKQQKRFERKKKAAECPELLKDHFRNTE